MPQEPEEASLRAEELTQEERAGAPGPAEGQQSRRIRVGKAHELWATAFLLEQKVYAGK